MAEPKKIIKGGLNIAKRLLADGEEAGMTAAQRAEAGRKAAELIKSQEQVKASEALGQLMEKGVKRTTTTQADRTRVGGGNIGGASFPAISAADPRYAGKVWGVMDEGTAARLKNLTDPETAWTTMLGSANQLKTNPLVFDKLKRGFVSSMKEGNLSDELAGKINHNLALTFGEGADIRDPKIWRQADTFEKRAALADVMMGQGIAPSKGGVAIGGEKSGKGVIFRPTDILKRETEPSLLHTEHGGDVPTFAAGPRLFRIEKESEFAPDLHPGFPTLLKGEDYGINMKPTPTEVYLPDWHKKFKKDNPERKAPGYYDLALGVKGEGLPSQELHDEYIRHLLREGFKKGGKVDIDAADRRLAAAIEKRMAKGGSVDIAASDARLEAAINARMGMAEGGSAGFKKIEFMADGGKLVKGAATLGKKLMADNSLPALEREANLKKFLEPSKTPMRLYHGTTATEGGKGEEAIRRIKPSKEGALGSGVYMTPNTAHASSYTGIPNDDALAMMSQGNDYTKKMADQFVADRAAGKLREGQAGGNMLPVHAQIRNPLIIGKSGRNIDPAADALMSLGMDEASAIRLVEKAFEDKGNIGKQIQTRAQAQGYDGIMQYRGDDLSEVVSYRPNAVKSAIGNRGTYDVNEPDLSKAHGGIAHMDKGGRAGKVASGLASVGKRLLADAPAEKKIIQSPNIIIPSKIGNVKEAARKSGGEYGARRVERAADEIPNLEKLYKEEALRQAFVGDNARAVMTMNPKDFENYAIPLQPRFMDKNSTRYTTSGERLDYPEYMSEYLPNVGAFNDVPFLLINKEEQGLPLVPFISGHEGRHRNRVMAGKGEQAGLVQLLPRSELREPFPRRSEEEYIDALREELKMTDDMVLPERFTDEFNDKIIRRPAVKLPDVYAEGGEAFKKLQFVNGYDGGGIAAPEYVDPFEGSRREPLLTKKDWENIKRNAPEVYDWAKQNVKDEASQLKTAKGVKDFALRTGAQYAGGIPDLVNLGLMGVDAVADTNLSSEKPWFGSEQYIDAMRKAGMIGENEFPIAETVAGVLAPAGLIKKGVKKVRNMRPVREEPKKRRGGLAAMAR